MKHDVDIQIIALVLIVLLLVVGLLVRTHHVLTRKPVRLGAPSRWALAWDNPGNDTNRTVCEIWSTTNLLSAFTPENTNWPWQPYPLTLSAPQRFYIVRARDTNSGLVSGWNTVTQPTNWNLIEAP